MTCILKDMRQGEGSDGRGIKGQEISEDWGMTFWRPVVGGGVFWRTWYIHFGEHVFRRTEGEKCQKEEQCVHNYITACRKPRFVSEETLLQG